MMTLRGNITAIIETCFSESKEKNKEIAIDRIMELIVLCKDCKASKVYQTDSSGVEGRFCEAFTQVRMVADDDFCSYGYREVEE